jgi:broad specificity phosphatase PhoE
MYILFLRHGESQDDLENRYGGWGDFPLTEKGREQVSFKIDSIKELKKDFKVILSSPLARALTSAKILSENLNIPVEVLEYIKERNTYGILTGMEKNEAKSKYPDQVENYGNENYVDGSERKEDIDQRVKKALDIIKNKGLKNVIVVTHGVFLKHLFALFGKKITKKEDGGWILVNLTDDKLEVISSNGIKVE